MALLVFLLTITFIFALFVLLPIFIKYLDRRDKRLKLLFIIPLVFIGISIYNAIYPPEEFYKADFTEVTGTEFPDRGEIIFKTASFPDHFGDYGSVSVIKVNKEFSRNLILQLRNKGFTKTTGIHGSNEVTEAFGTIDESKIERQFSMEQKVGVYYYVGFLSDEETIIVIRQSS